MGKILIQIAANGLAVWFCKPTTPLQSNDKLSKAYKLYRLLALCYLRAKIEIMPSCEKCWEDAWGNAEKYQELIEERKDNPCTHEEQAGRDAKNCQKCNRKTVHQYAKVCVMCGSK